jgi:hypothetical protein
VAQLAHTDAPALDNFPVPHVIHALWPAEPWYLKDKDKPSKEGKLRQLAQAHNSCN